MAEVVHSTGQQEETSYCPGCEKHRPVSMFYPRSGENSHLLRSYCKDCANKKRRERYNDDEEHRQKVLQRSREWREEKEFDYEKAETSTCPSCGEEKPSSEFYADPAKSDGCSTYCKPCNSEKNEEWRKENEDHVKEYNKQRWWEDVEENRAELRQRYRENSEMFKENVRRWQEENPEKAREYKRRNRHMRRAVIYGVDADPDIDLRALYEEQNGLCGICDDFVPKGEASLDHIVPISRGGDHTWDNVQMAHLSCNIEKGDTMPSELNTHQEGN